MTKWIAVSISTSSTYTYYNINIKWTLNCTLVVVHVLKCTNKEVPLRSVLKPFLLHSSHRSKLSMNHPTLQYCN